MTRPADDMDAAVERGLARMRAERIAKGWPPLIQNPGLYRLLDAMLAAAREKSDAAPRP